MPVEARLSAIPGGNARRVRLARSFHDLLERPLSGKVRILGEGSTRDGSHVVMHDMVVRELKGGVLDVQLPPGTYRLEADLWSIDDVVSHHEEIVTLEE